MTHNERVLNLLKDHKPHTHHELYALHVIGHSRIADLRRQGHVIAVWREGDNYLYRLLSDGRETNGTTDTPPTPPAVSGDAPIAEGSDGQLAFATSVNSYERDA
jgi:hypothetical protein